MGKKRNKEDKPLLYRMMGRTVVFLFLFVCALLLFFTLGNFQSFTDENQNLILSVCVIFSVLMVFFTALTLIVSLIYAIIGDSEKRRAPYIITVLVMALLLALGAVFFVFADSISFISGW